MRTRLAVWLSIASLLAAGQMYAQATSFSVAPGQAFYIDLDTK